MISTDEQGAVRIEPSDAQPGVVLLTVDNGDKAITARLHGEALIRFVQAVGEVYMACLVDMTKAELRDFQQVPDKKL